MNDISAKITHLLAEFDNFLFDCDGVLWCDNKLIDGAKACLDLLHKMDKKIYLLTNNSTKTRTEFAAKCQRLGLNVTANEIICTAAVAAEVLKLNDFKGKLYVLGMDSIHQELTNAGIPHVMADEVKPEGTHGFDGYENVKLDPEITGVLVGFDADISYMRILKAASYINHGAAFYATNDDAYFPTNTGITLPGTGVMVSSVAVASASQPMIIGKPHEPFFTYLKSIHGFDPAKSVMIGDRLDTDILFANKVGLFSVLVMSGVTNDAVLTKALSEPNGKSFEPSYCIPSVKSFVEHYHQSNSSL